MVKGLIGMLGGLLIAVALIGGLGGDTDAAQLAAERTERTALVEQGRTDRAVIQESEQTARTALQEGQRTERTYINAQQLMWLATEREATVRLVVVLLIVAIVATAAVVVAVQVLRRLPSVQADRAFAPPRYVRAVVAQMPGHTLDYDVEYGWIVVEPGGRQFYTIADAERLLTRR